VYVLLINHKSPLKIKPRWPDLATPVKGLICLSPERERGT